MKKQRIVSAKTREKIRVGHIGLKHSEATIKKMQVTHRQNMTKEKRDHLSKLAKERNANMTKKQKEQRYSFEWRKKLSEALKGKNGSNWQGGKAGLFNRVKRNFRYKLWRDDVLERDNYTCQLCGLKDKSNHAHHIVKLRTIFENNLLKIKNYDFDIPLMWDINNGKTYCKACHRLIHAEDKPLSLKKRALYLIKIIPENVLPEEIKIQVIEFKKKLAVLRV